MIHPFAPFIGLFVFGTVMSLVSAIGMLKIADRGLVPTVTAIILGIAIMVASTIAATMKILEKII